jgi:hypothetical protein
MATDAARGGAAMVEQLDQLALGFADRHAGQDANLAAATAVHRRYREAAERVLAELVATAARSPSTTCAKASPPASNRTTRTCCPRCWGSGPSAG